MAIIKCRFCGENISDKAVKCPHCGNTLIMEMEQEAEPTKCEECGAEIPEGADSCPKCGCPVLRSDGEIAEDLSKLNGSSSLNQTKINISDKAKKTITIALAAIVLIAAVFIINQNTLTGDDKVAFELVYDAAQEFRNPSSVRLVSGTVGVDKDCLFCGISGTNGAGARITSYYYISDFVMEKDDPNYLYKAKDQLHIKKINRKLEKALGPY